MYVLHSHCIIILHSPARKIPIFGDPLTISIKRVRQLKVTNFLTTWAIIEEHVEMFMRTAMCIPYFKLKQRLWGETLDYGCKLILNTIFRYITPLLSLTLSNKLDMGCPIYFSLRKSAGDFY